MRVLSFGHGVQPVPAADLVLDCRRMRSADPRQPYALLLLARARRFAQCHPGATIAFGCHYGQLRSCTLADVLAAEFGIVAEHTAPPEVDDESDNSISKVC